MTFADDISVNLRESAHGDLVVMEWDHPLDSVVRQYFLFDEMAGATHGSHALKECNQVIVCLRGRAEVRISTGRQESSTELGVERRTVEVPCGTWRVIRTLEDDTALLVICDKHYAEDDYIHDFAAFLAWSTERS